FLKPYQVFFLRLLRTEVNYGSNAISILAGNREGTFQPAIYCNAQGATATTAVDFNGDVAITYSLSSNTISVLLGTTISDQSTTTTPTTSTSTTTTTSTTEMPSPTESTTFTCYRSAYHDDCSYNAWMSRMSDDLYTYCNNLSYNYLSNGGCFNYCTAETTTSVLADNCSCEYTGAIVGSVIGGVAICLFFFSCLYLADQKSEGQRSQ
ncbi:MAG: hypothetical protein AB8U91_05855, partial [Candidatus Midichloria sp.]